MTSSCDNFAARNVFHHFPPLFKVLPICAIWAAVGKYWLNASGCFNSVLSHQTGLLNHIPKSQDLIWASNLVPTLPCDVSIAPPCYQPSVHVPNIVMSYKSFWSLPINPFQQKGNSIALKFAVFMLHFPVSFLIWQPLLQPVN